MVHGLHVAAVWAACLCLFLPTVEQVYAVCLSCCVRLVWSLGARVRCVHGTVSLWPVGLLYSGPVCCGLGPYMPLETTPVVGLLCDGFSAIGAFASVVDIMHRCGPGETPTRFALVQLAFHYGVLCSAFFLASVQSLCVRFVRLFLTLTSAFVAASYPDRSYYGPPTYECPYCGAMFWYQERVKSASAISKRKIIYNLCCKGGRIRLPKLRAPPEPLASLLNYNGDACLKNFLRQIRSYNSMFAFSSMGAAIDISINTGNAPYVFKINGVVHHRIGTLVPSRGSPPKFAQLYVYDLENELQNRLNIFENDGDNSDKADPEILRALSSMLDAKNTLVQSFRYARERVIQHGDQQVTLRLLGCNAKDDVQYNLPTNSEIATVIVGDFSAKEYKFDVLVYDKGRGLRQISPLHPSYMALQYPLLFPYGERGFHLGIKYSNYDGIGKKYVTMPEYYRYEMHYRLNEPNPFTCYGRLSDQIDVDIFSTIETNRLQYFIDHQKELRSESVDGIVDAIDKGVTDGDSIGKRVILPASFTGGRRYMVMNYQDAMAICPVYGSPDLFVTYTCNSKWQEIADAIRFEPGQQPSDRADIIVRVFNMKVNEFITDIREGKTFGKVLAVLYTVEFQKRGLPHIYCLVWLAAATADVSASVIDGFICAEIPDYDTDRLGYELVSEFMMHGPCGDANKKCHCMKNEKCSKHYPKDFQDETIVDESGFTIYRRRNNGRSIMKNGILLDNRSVVPYNMALLKKYEAHINVEWCNKSNLIKYLFKYITKGHDRARIYFETTAKTQNASPNHDLAPRNEILEYMDARFLSTYEELHQLFEFDIHYRVSPVERLVVHLPGKNFVRYEKGADLRAVLESPGAKRSMLTEWFETNKKNSKAHSLTYCEFPKEWTWEPSSKTWHERTPAPKIGRIYYVHPTAGELYYLRMLLMIVKGAQSYADVRTYDGVVYGTYREAYSLVQQLNNDQIIVFNTICSRAVANEPGFFFVSGHGGTGKTFLWNTIIAKLRSQNKIVLAVASSGVASLLLPRAVGDGTLPMIAREGENYPAWITIPDDLLVMTSGDKIAAIVHEVYSDFLTCYRDIEYLASRAIVCPTNTTVDEINDYIIGLVPGDSRVYLSCDTISKSSEQIPDFDLLYPPEFLNSINATNFPTHKLVLKEGVVVMLLRNLNQSIGLCNGTRLLVTVLGERILQCIVLTGSNIGQTVYIPRITLGTTKMKWPFTLQRRQFPVRVCYSMTINKSQGQTLQRVGVYLKKPVFTHGQLYVAISRVTSRSGLKILIENDDGSCGTQTKNIVYSEVLSATLQAVVSRTSKMAHVLISQLSCGDLNTRILARVSRLWDFCDLNDSGNIFHTDLVLLNQMGNSIHAQIYPPAIQSLKPLLKEQKGTYRPVDNSLMIVFSKWTTLEECIEPAVDFLGITFSLTPFSDIPNLVDQTIFYVGLYGMQPDVMGVITEVGSPAVVRPKSRNADSLKRTIQICDASNSTKPVTLWGERADAFDANSVYNAGQTQAQVIVFVGTLVKDYTGLGLTVTGSSPCKWYLNLDIPEVLELKESFSANFRPVSWVDNPATGYNQDTAEEKTIQEILTLNPHKNRSTRFIVNVTVRRICSENSWWYNSCRLCYRTSKPYGSSYKCSSCSNIGIPDPRYKVVLIAGDASSNATFILFGRVAHHLIKRSVESLIEGNPPDSDYIPAEIAALVDSRFTWNLSFTRDIVKRSQESLQVNTIVSSGPSNEPLLLMPPGSSQEPSAIASASSSSSVQTGPQQSQTSSESQQLVQQGHSTSTPTKSPIGTPTQSTPTSKPSSSTPGKKSIVVSMCHMQPLSASVDATIKDEVKHPEHAPETAVVANSPESKAKETPKHEEDIPQTAATSTTAATAKKREKPALLHPSAKKLKDAA
uniref:ATP-dependent DNA helicase n=1 Tax=Oryza meridionalis TaxID=40149 RepID=A0A0E0C530_9ORYZ